MAKLKEPILFIVIPPGYNTFIKVYADWETEKSFGIRGESFDCVRYTRSTGEMYNKNTSVWKKIENEKDADSVIDELNRFENNIDRLKEELRLEIDKMKNYLKNG